MKDKEMCGECHTHGDNKCKKSVRKPEAKKPLRRPKLRYRNNIKMDLKLSSVYINMGFALEFG
jgi:hypothetical protein